LFAPYFYVKERDEADDEQFLSARRDALFKSSADTLPGRSVFLPSFSHGKKIATLPRSKYEKNTQTGLTSRSAPVALSAVFCSILVSRTLHFQKLTWFAWVLLVSGTGLNALMRPDSNAGILYVLRIIPAVGAGFLFQLPLYAVQANSEDKDLGIATATMTFFRSIGQAFGVAVGGTVFQNQFDKFVRVAIGARGIPKEFVP
jgi:hypothetical protein